MEQLEQLAHHLGIHLQTHTGGVKGWYANGIISLRAGLSPRLRRCTLAHELAHHIYGDEATRDELLDRRIERRADQWAANLLISVDNYIDAETLYGADLHQIANELDVTLHLLEVWREMHRPLGR